MKLRYVNLSILALSALVFFTACKETDVKQPSTAAAKEKQTETAAVKKNTVSIKTDYHEIKGMNREKLRNILKSENLDNLTADQLDILRQYALRTVVRGQGDSPFPSRLVSNYFWYIYNALPAVVPERERHYGYYRNQGDMLHSDRLRAYAIYNLDRSSENIRKIFALYKDELREIFPKAVYEHKYRQIVDNIIRTYNYLKGIDNYREKLQSFYDEYYTKDKQMKVDTNEKISEVYEGAYGFSAFELAEQLSHHLGLDRYSPVYGSNYLSFWMRRNHEGNIDAVREILLEIQNVYE